MAHGVWPIRPLPRGPESVATLLRDLKASKRTPSDEERAQITHTSRNGMNVAHYAAACHKVEILQNLFDLHLDFLLSAHTKEGFTPAHYAARPEELRFLVAAGANVNEKAFVEEYGKEMTPIEFLGANGLYNDPDSPYYWKSASMSKLERAAKEAYRFPDVFMSALSRGYFSEDLVNPKVMRRIWKNTIKNLEELRDTTQISGKLRMLHHPSFNLQGTPRNFKHLLPAFQEAFRTAMLLFRRNQSHALKLPAMPLEMWLLILSMLTQFNFAKIQAAPTKTSMRDTCVVAPAHLQDWPPWPAAVPKMASR